MTSYLRILPFLIPLLGCGSSTSQPEVLWDRHGVRDGELVRPRAIAIDSEDQLYIVDFTARIQTFDRDLNYLGRTWTTPDYRNGRPSGLSIGRDGNLLVSDSHYHRVRVYAPHGKELFSFGEAGTEPGKLGYVSDVVQDERGDYYVAEFGEVQRISVFDEKGRFQRCWGSKGMEPGQFSRPRALALGPDGLLYVADACNHRIQVFSKQGKLIRVLGGVGTGAGRFRYPYDVAIGPEDYLYVAEYGNHRVQKLTREGKPLATWGGPGRKPGQLHTPWAVAVDSRGAVHVVDTENHRIQRIGILRSHIQ